MPTTTLSLRIDPDKKAALGAIAERQRMDVSKLILPLIDKLLEEEGGNEKPPLSNEPQEAEDIALTGQINLSPLPGDELFLKRYAAKRQMKPATVVKLLLRAWATGGALVPKEELGKLELLSNRIAAIGRLINQLVRLAHTGQIEHTQELADLIKAVQPLIAEARAETKNFIAANLKSWEIDYG
jgi:hypothetical protein